MIVHLSSEGGRPAFLTLRNVSRQAKEADPAS